MPDQRNSPANGGDADRRTHSRVPVSSLAYVELGEANGGIVVNLSESGLALTTALPLPGNDLPGMRIQMPKSRQWIEASGEIMWMSDSRKRAGVRFVNLTEESRARIEGWLFLEAGALQSAEAVTTLAEPPGRPPAPPAILTPQRAFLPLPERREDGGRELENSGISNPQATLQCRSTKASPASATPEPEIRRSRPSASRPSLPQSPSIDEQRAFERQRVTALAYVELGECNGGIILDIGEGGIHVRAAVPLAVDEIPSLRFQLPLREDWIETSGQVAWMDESRTVAGIEFVDLPDEAAEQIRDWIASAASAEAPPGQLSAVRERTERLLAALPHAPAGPPGAIGRKLAALPAGEQVAPAARAVAAPVLFSPTAIRIEQPYQVSASRSGTSGLAAGAGTGPRRPSWVAFAVSVGLAALLSFAAAWFLSGRSGMNRMVAMVQDLAGHPNAPETSAQPSLTTSAPQGGPQVPGPAAPTVPTQEPARQPTSVSPPPAGAASSSAPLPGNSSARQGGQSTPGTAKTSARVTTAGGAAFPNGVPASGATEPSVRPVEIPPLQAAQQAGAAPSQSVEIPPAAAAPPPQPVEIVRGTVTVSASPYPSIRITPEMKERAAKEGTALQIGQLTSRVEPGYPNDAQQQRIEGTVMLRARIGRDGTVQSIDVIGGPPLLVPAAMDAVRQWRYNQTLFGGQPVEAEHNITIVFRLTKQQLQPQTN